MADNDSKENDGGSPSQTVSPKSLVTEEHVRAALTADKGVAAAITAWKVVDFTKKGDNYACVVTSVHVDYTLDGRASQVVYVVKVNSSQIFDGAEEFNDMIFGKEAKFYSILAPKLNSVLRENGRREINFPKCFHTSLESGRQVIFLEDLRPRGYKMFDRRHGMDEPHATLVLRELARLHAASLLLQANTPKQTLKEIYPFLEKNLYHLINDWDYMRNTILDESLKLTKEILNKVGGYERVIAWIDTLFPKLTKIFYEQIELGEPKMVCHGDTWTTNLLFRYNEDGQPEDVMLIDLQMVRYSIPATELSYLFFTCMTGDVMKANIDIFLGHYYSTFKSIMEDAGQEVPFTQEQLSVDYKHKKLLGLIFAIMVIPDVILESNDEADTATCQNENLEHMAREIHEKMMETLGTNPLLKPRLLSIFDVAMEEGIIP